ncbi:FAD-dependent oxidoreductase [Tessaracoccus sp. MC1756]|uniref:FAD-dependent oxidoreductase n=1 Tax=Tessaracoccus sp. MC1756 TaxID=2760311 RepID=UPI0016044FB7|nr:FAD-dependent oxidoreductase [Tessaracoccus sp. MC1756]MBB1509693.1 FAD-binding oxidoreductase [Tessaracoccus sp. MC1756]
MAHDVVVLGATVAGLTVARLLASEGFGVVVLDPNDEGVSAATGHGVAAIGHASTVATMAHFYGLAAAREHTRRNIAGLAQIREVYPDAQPMMLRDRSLPGGDEAETLQLAELYRGEGGEAEVLVAPDSISLMTQALVVDPIAYAAELRAAAVRAGANVVHGVTVTHLTRREGATRIYFRNNMAWLHDVGHVTGMAVIDTLGVSPWGRVARIGPAEWVPVVRCRPAAPLTEVSLYTRPEVWMVRPTGDTALLLGQKTTLGGVEHAAEALGAWAVEHLGATEIEHSRLAIDPSDHGRPVVGASAIPGGFYARGNGRGELMNGTASGHYLARLLAGHQRSDNALPPISKIRALGSRMLRSL